MKFQTAFTAPHHEAAKVGLNILELGGTASEAMVAAAAMVSVQYPHMNSIGGDSFWIIAEKGKQPVTIDGCGAAAQAASIESYRNDHELPTSGAKAAITMAGTISAWDRALQRNSSGISLSQLLTPAIEAARDGIVVTQSLANASQKTYDRLHWLKDFSALYLNAGQCLKQGDRITNPQLASTFELLAANGLADFYRGELASRIADDLMKLGSPIASVDLATHHAQVGIPLSVITSRGRFYNHDAPTQGLASLLILAIYDRVAAKAYSEIDHVHLLVEATKQAFIIRDSKITDPKHSAFKLQSLLNDVVINQCVNDINMAQAKPWPHIAKPGDTVWMGATDQYGTMVSFIQSVYWEFGSGLVLPKTGIVWNNRGTSFSLDSQHHNGLVPGKKPFHTLNPAYAELNDGSRMVYGTMGGEGQPQTQACLYSRYLYQNQTLEQAIANPRWLLGRTWGDDTNQLRLEKQLYDSMGDALGLRGHNLTSVANNNELMGHAGAIVLTESGNAIAASDPRSDGLGIHGVKNGHE